MPLAATGAGFSKLGGVPVDRWPLRWILYTALIPPPLVAVGFGVSVWRLLGPVSFVDRSSLVSSPARTFILAWLLGLSFSFLWLRLFPRVEVTYIRQVGP